VAVALAPTHRPDRRCDESPLAGTATGSVRGNVLRRLVEEADAGQDPNLRAAGYGYANGSSASLKL